MILFEIEELDFGKNILRFPPGFVQFR